MPLEGLLYTIGVCTYGGRLTDSWDVRTLMALLKKFFSPHFFNGHKYSLGNLQITFPSDEKVDIQTKTVLSERVNV